MLTSLEEKHVKNVYQEIAPHFSNTRVYTWNWITDFVTSLPEDSWICDVGCGNGRNMHFPNYNFIGVDNCRAFLDICESRGLQTVEANMTSLPFQSDRFDAIICIASFHHLYTDDSKLQTLLELKRIIKSTGKILLSVWSKTQPLKTRRTFATYGHNYVDWNKYGRQYTRYYYIFKDNEIKRLFNRAGLYLVDQKHDCGNEIYTLVK